MQRKLKNWDYPEFLDNIRSSNRMLDFFTLEKTGVIRGVTCPMEVIALEILAKV